MRDSSAAILVASSVVAGLLLAIPAHVSIAQAPAPQAPPSAASQAAPDRITINVQVTDKLGHSIDGLKLEDFTLLDNKQQAKITDFHEIDSRSPGADPVQIIIVIDNINTAFNVVARERAQLAQYLNQDGGHLAHPTSLAFLTDKGLTMEPGSTRDGATLLATLDKTQPGLRTVSKSAGYWGATERLQLSLDQLIKLGQFGSTLPGRKLAFFISPGWPLLAQAGVEESDKQRQWTFRTIVGITNGLRESNMTLYTLDPFNLGESNPFLYQSYLKGIPGANKAEYPNLGLQVFAAHTGGLVQTSGMDIVGEINNAVRDADHWYTLTFEAPPPDHLNEYHDLRVTVDKPGAQVRTTSGYYANTRF